MNRFYHALAYCELLSLLLALALITSCTPQMAQVAAAPPVEKPERSLNSPLLEDSFAVSSVWGGGVWRIFVKGSDTDGDMQGLWVNVTQLGGRSANEFIPLSGPNRREFSGYIALNTPQWFQGWQYVRVEIRIRDAGGRYSNMRMQEVRVGAPTAETVPEVWRSAAANRLGTIFFEFERLEDDLRPSHFHR